MATRQLWKTPLAKLENTRCKPKCQTFANHLLHFRHLRKNYFPECQRARDFNVFAAARVQFNGMSNVWGMWQAFFACNSCGGGANPVWGWQNSYDFPSHFPAPLMLPMTHKMCVTIVAVFVVNNFPMPYMQQLHMCVCVFVCVRESALFIVPVDDSLVDCFSFVCVCVCVCAYVLTVHAHNAHLHIERSHTYCSHGCLAWSCGSCIVIATFAAAVATAQLQQLLLLQVIRHRDNSMSLKPCSSCALNCQGDSSSTAGCLTIGPVIQASGDRWSRGSWWQLTLALQGLCWCVIKMKQPH